MKDKYLRRRLALLFVIWLALLALLLLFNPPGEAGKHITLEFDRLMLKGSRSA